MLSTTVPHALAPPIAAAPAEARRLVVQRVEAVDALDDLGPEWQRLADVAADGLPFRTFEWHRAWWRHLRADGARVRDALAVLAVRSPAGELVGVAPFMRTERPGVGPVRIRAIEAFGADMNVTEVRGTICAPGWDGPVTSAILADLAARTGTWDVMHWRGVREASAAHAVLASCAGTSRRDANPTLVLSLPATWEEFRASRRRNIKESLRKCYNSLRRDGHAFTFHVVRDERLVGPALERFFALHRARAELRGTVPHPDVFASEASRAFLTEVCSRLARRDMVRIFQLRIRGEVVATRIGFAIGDTVYLYYSGYDPEWRRYSVMTTAVAEAIRWAIGQRLRHVNLSTSTDVAKARWDPEPIELCDFVQTAPGLRSRLAARVYDAVAAARRIEALRFLRRAAAPRPSGA